MFNLKTHSCFAHHAFRYARKLHYSRFHPFPSLLYLSLGRTWWTDEGVQGRDVWSNCSPALSLLLSLYERYGLLEVEICWPRLVPLLPLWMKLKIATQGRGRLSRCPPITDTTSHVSVCERESMSAFGETVKPLLRVRLKSDAERKSWSVDERQFKVGKKRERRQRERGKKESEIMQLIKVRH